MVRDIDVLNGEMIAAGVRIFAGGLTPPRNAKSLRAQPGGKVLITDGPCLETKEHVGGFWILEVADMDEALAWGRKAVIACRAPVEVRSFFHSDPTGLLARTPLKEGMTQYLATIYLPDNFDPSAQDKEVESDFDALSEEMEASGVKEVFAGGLSPARGAKSLRAQPDGKVLITDGPYLDQGAHSWSFDRASRYMDEALTWTRKGAVVCRTSGEVRSFFRSNTPSE